LIVFEFPSPSAQYLMHIFGECQWRGATKRL